MKRSIWIGFDTRQAGAYAICRHSIRSRLVADIPVRPVTLSDLRRRGLYTRSTSRLASGLWDDISDAPMSTEFAISRFLVPHLAEAGWALFMDSDMLVRCDLNEVFAIADPSKAVMVVKHIHTPTEAVKMDQQIQTTYARKNWSSFVLFNCDHPANRALTVGMVNSRPGRDLHAFCWLDDSDIGELGPEWNWLAGHSPETVKPKVIHFTDGCPHMPGYERAPYAHEWLSEMQAWAA